MSQTTQLDEIRVLLESQDWFRYDSNESLLENLKHALHIPSQEDVPAEIPTHVDEFIDYGWSREVGNDRKKLQTKYARFVLLMARFPAMLQFDFEAFTKPYQLFCSYEGERYKVVGASRMGDVWLTKDVNSDQYQKRVVVDKCSDWSNTFVFEDCTVEETYKETK